VPRPGGQAVLDTTDLEFLDVRALRDLDRHAADTGAIILLRSPPNPVPKLLEMMDLHALRPEPLT